MPVTWFILGRDGHEMPKELLPLRPYDADPLEYASPFTPWHKEESHLHFANGQLDGIHAKGELNVLRQVLKQLVMCERILLDYLGPDPEEISIKESHRIIRRELKRLRTLKA